MHGTGAPRSRLRQPRQRQSPGRRCLTRGGPRHGPRRKGHKAASRSRRQCSKLPQAARRRSTTTAAAAAVIAMDSSTRRRRRNGLWQQLLEKMKCKRAHRYC